MKVLLWTNIGGSGLYIMYWTLVSSLSQHISQEESCPHPPKEYGNTINGRERGGRPLKNVYELLPGINIKPRKYPKNLSKHFILVHCKLIGANILITILSYFEISGPPHPPPPLKSGETFDTLLVTKGAHWSEVHKRSSCLCLLITTTLKWLKPIIIQEHFTWKLSMMPRYIRTVRLWMENNVPL